MSYAQQYDFGVLYEGLDELEWSLGDLMNNDHDLKHNYFSVACIDDDGTIWVRELIYGLLSNEEQLKTLIHELLHSIRKDYLVKSGDQETWIKKIFSTADRRCKKYHKPFGELFELKNRKVRVWPFTRLR